MCCITAIHRLVDKRTFLIDVLRDEKLIVSISGKTHQIYLTPTILLEGLNAEIVKIDETKGCNLFCLGKIKTQNILCVAVKKSIYIYEINSNLKPKYKRLRDIESTINCQLLQIVHSNMLCVGYQSEFTLYTLDHEDAPIALLQIDRDKSLEFLSKEPLNALMCIHTMNDEYLLVFESMYNEDGSLYLIANLFKTLIFIQDLGIYVNINGRRNRNEEIMWPTKPTHVSYLEPYLLCFSDRGIDVFNTKSSDWIQTLQFAKVCSN
jgi:hypothetical protein